VADTSNSRAEIRQLGSQVRLTYLGIVLVGLFSAVVVRHEITKQVDVVVITDTHSFARVGRVFRSTIADVVGGFGRVTVDVVESLPSLDIAAAAWALLDVVWPVGETVDSGYKPFWIGGTTFAAFALVNPGAKESRLRVIGLSAESTTRLVFGVDNGTLEVLAAYVLEMDKLNHTQVAKRSRTCLLSSEYRLYRGDGSVESAARALAAVIADHGRVDGGSAADPLCCTSLESWVGAAITPGRSPSEVTRCPNQSERAALLPMPIFSDNGSKPIEISGISLIDCHGSSGNCRSNLEVARRMVAASSKIRTSAESIAFGIATQGSSTLDVCPISGTAVFNICCAGVGRGNECSLNGDGISVNTSIKEGFCLRDDFDQRDSLILVRDSLGFGRFAIGGGNFMQWLQQRADQLPGSRRNLAGEQVLDCKVDYRRTTIDVTFH
jgi:hypothetical protein